MKTLFEKRDPIDELANRTYPTSQIVHATKALVDSLLSMNTSNRPIKKTVVDRYVNEIKSGRWFLTNQGIGVSSTGVLIDGQHRLEAIKQAGYPPVQILIVNGISDDAKLAVDQHAKRSARDILQFAFSCRVSRSAPAIATTILAVINGKHKHPSMYEVFDCVSKYATEIEQVVEMPKNMVFFAAPYLAAIVYSLHNGIGDVDRAKDFLQRVESGEMLTKDDPRFHLRNSIITTKQTCGGSTIRTERFLKAMKAYAAHINGQKMGTLRV